MLYHFSFLYFGYSQSDSISLFYIRTIFSEIFKFNLYILCISVLWYVLCRCASYSTSISSNILANEWWLLSKHILRH